MIEKCLMYYNICKLTIFTCAYAVGSGTTLLDKSGPNMLNVSRCEVVIRVCANKFLLVELRSDLRETQVKSNIKTCVYKHHTITFSCILIAIGRRAIEWKLK